MKNGLQINPMVFKAIFLLSCFMLVMLHNKSKAAGTGQAQVHVVAKR